MLSVLIAAKRFIGYGIICEQYKMGTVNKPFKKMILNVPVYVFFSK